MKGKQKLRIGVDLAMTALLPVLMAYSLVGEAAHEWLGLVMTALFAAHLILNRKWFGSIGKGPCTADRLLLTLVNLLLLAMMLALPVSGIGMSKHVFASLSIGGADAFRIVHLLAGYWGFVLMCVHLGFHWGMVLGIFRKAAAVKAAGKQRPWVSRGLVLMLSAYGGYAFCKRQLGTYLLLKSQFVFFDFGEPLIRFFSDYLAIMVLFGAVGYYLRRLVGIRQKRRQV